MNRQLFPALLLWIVLTVVGEILAFKVDIYAVPKSDKGEEIDFAFRYLVYLAVPVVAMVLAVLISSMALGSSMSLPDQDGPPMHGRGSFPVVWFGLTSLLAIVVMVYPGLVGIPRVMSNEANPDVLVNVEGVQWTWLVSYPNEHIDSTGEIVLPIDSTVRFDITSRDVLHSFWIPSFLLKIDAVPGMTTKMSLKPTKTGSYQVDPNLRVQCAELCGLSHSKMMVPVRVVSRDEYDAWVQKQSDGPEAEQTPTGPVKEITIIAKGIKFDQDTITVASGSSIKLTVDNQDGGIPHNIAFYTSKDAATSGEAPLAKTKIENGPKQQTLVFNAPAAGSYFFRCDVHPTTMTGTFIVQ